MEELDLKELFLVFWNKKLEIILITILLMIVGVVYSYFFITPLYKSSTSLVLAQSSATVEQSGQEAITQSDITMNSKLVSTYSELIKSKAVLRQVVQNLNMDGITESVIKNNVSVQAVKDTELIQITVKNEDPNTAALIANEIAKVFSDKIVEIYNISNIYILDRAEPEETPANINHAKDIVIFAFIGVVLAVAYVLILNMLDTTIKTEEDVEKSIGLLVLSSIPDYEVEINNKRKGGRR